MATPKRLDTFILEDELGLDQKTLLDEAQASAIRRSETMGWVNVSVRPAAAPASSKGKCKCHSFEIWGTEAQTSVIDSPDTAAQSRVSKDIAV